MKPKEESLLWRYAIWAEDQDDLDAPLLYGVMKFMLFSLLPIIVMIFVALAVIGAAIALFISIMPTIIDWVWI